jgi:imidazolonepropionase-like amidohydrolase
MAFEDHYSFALHKVGLLISGLALLVPLSIYGQDVAFVNVNIVPMDRERVLGAQTVLISGGQIKAMGAVRKIALPKGTLRVDGTGKYLMPGLADMHGHLSHRGPAMTYPLETFPLLLVAHGATTLRNMAGYPAVLSLRQQIDTGATLGPRIFTTGPSLKARPRLPPTLRQRVQVRHL